MKHVEHVVVRSRLTYYGDLEEKLQEGFLVISAKRLDESTIEYILERKRNLKLRELLLRIENTITYDMSYKDWSENEHDALLYGILSGWYDDNFLIELSKKFNWDDATVDYIRESQKALAFLKGWI